MLKWSLKYWIAFTWGNIPILNPLWMLEMVPSSIWWFLISTIKVNPLSIPAVLVMFIALVLDMSLTTLKKLPKSEIICCKIVFFVCTLLNGDSLYIVGLVLNVQQGPDEVGKIMNRSAQFLSSPANSQYWSKSSQESDPACHNMEYSSSVFLELFKTFSRKPYFSTNWPSSSSFFASLYFCILSLLINKSYFGSLKLKSLIKGNNSFYI